jgi:23S rRNA (uracil1939-C5)-methyltransferase
MGLCQNAGKCGGCYYQGIPYEEQLNRKEREVRELLDPVIREPYVFESIIPSPLSTGYRNKMEFSFGDCEKDGPLTLGLHQKKSFYNILNTDDCQLPHQDVDRILHETRMYFTELGVHYFHKRTHTGYLRHLLVRRASKTGEILVDLVTSTDTAEFETGEFQSRMHEIASDENSVEKAENPETAILNGWKDRMLRLESSGALEGKFAGILHTRNESLSDAVIDNGTDVLYGESFFYEELLGLHFRITPFSFFQTNSLGAERLYTKVREYAGYDLLKHDQESGSIAHKPVIYDLYSGTGTITQLMSSVASQAIGVEIVKEAVDAARDNARLNGITNCHFIAGDVMKVIQEGGELLREDGTREDAPRPDLIILDPPRDGVQPKPLRKIIDYGVEKLIYVACKPKSLARDLVPLQSAGYHVEKVCPVDMFPQTNNVEVVCLMRREKNF